MNTGDRRIIITVVHLEVGLRGGGGGGIELTLPQGGSELFFTQLMINETGEGGSGGKCGKIVFEKILRMSTSYSNTFARLV